MQQLWTEGDIQAYITNQTKEHIGLDYKCSDALQNTDGKKNEISKDVSAFANSAGGMIIYGVEEHGNLPVKIDSGVDPAVTTREWLEQVINSRIHQRVDGVRIFQVDLVTASPGRVAYVVEIPQATTRAPHQASDNRYYKRFNFQSIPMEDYEVRDAFRRSESPELYLELALPSAIVQLQYPGAATISNAIVLKIAIGNRAGEPAQHAVVELCVDHRVAVGSHQYWDVMGPTTIDVAGNPYTVQVLRRAYGIPGQLPIFAGFLQPLDGLVNFTLDNTALYSSINYYLGWSIKAPRMNEQRDSMWLTAHGTGLRIMPA